MLLSTRAAVQLFAIASMFLPLSESVEAGTPGCRVSLAVNPVKIAYGLVNLEVEYQTAPRVAIVVWGEYLFSTHIYDRQGHPDAVGRMGLRMFARCREDGRADGFSIMPFLARSWTNPCARSRGVSIGAEAAYRWQDNGSWFGSPKALVTWPVGSPKVLPGIEMMLGYHCR